MSATLVAFGGEVSIAAELLKKSYILDRVYKDTACGQIPLQNCTHFTIQKIVEWLEHHNNEDLGKQLKIEEGKPTPKLPKWDKAFFDKLSNTDLLRIVQAAEYLQIDELSTMACRRIADLLRMKPIKQIRSEWNIQTGWTVDEERKHVAMFAW